MTRRGSHLAGLARRRALHELDRSASFGLILGWLLILVGCSRRFLMVGPPATLWSSAILLGGLLLAGATICPTWLRPVEALPRKVLGRVGGLLLRVLLTLVYFVAVWPVGLVLRRSAGAAKISRWNDDEQAPASRFSPRAGERAQRGTVGPLLLEPFRIFAFVSRHGSALLLPVLVILLAAGLLLFFAETSAVATFIYTLF